MFAELLIKRKMLFNFEGENIETKIKVQESCESINQLILSLEASNLEQRCYEYCLKNFKN